MKTIRTSHRLEPLEARIVPAFSGVFDLSAILEGGSGYGVNGIGIVGEAGFGLGYSLDGVGDTRGDGVPDISVAVPGGNGGFGSLFTYRGTAADFDPSDIAKVNGFDSSVQFGFSVRGAGDINADGLADIIGAAPLEDGSGTDRGKIYVAFGRASGITGEVNEFDGSSGFAISGIADDDQLSVGAAAGDVNGDGFGDIILGASRANEGGVNRGAVYVLFGKAEGFAAEFSLNSLNGTNGFKISGVADDDFLGASVAGAGDVNGDGYDDIVFGAPSADEGGATRGAAYVVFGKPTFSAAISAGTLDGTTGFKVRGITNGDRLGDVVESGGDVNGDGFGDVLIGAPFADEGGTDRGATYVVFGRATGFLPSNSASTLTGGVGFKISGASDGAKAGKSSGAADVNGDGYDDIIVGAPFVGVNYGAAYVVYGKPVAASQNVPLATLTAANGFTIPGITHGGRAGIAVAGLGDFNADGIDDFAIGADGAGAAFIIFGQSGADLKIAPTGKLATFTDFDGDLVSVKITKGTLSRDDFTFSNGNWQKLTLNDGDRSLNGTNITVTVAKSTAGDGRVNLGALDATGFDLGTVTIPGDVGQVDAGDTFSKTPAIKKLTLASLGGIAGTQPAGTPAAFVSDLFGSLGKLTVSGNVFGAINVTGKSAGIGAAMIGGDLDGSTGGVLGGLLRAAGNIGAVTVKGTILGGATLSGIVAGRTLGKVSIDGDLRSNGAFVTVSALGKLGSSGGIAGITVKGNVERANILAGYTTSLAAANPNASIGSVLVGGNWTGSNIASGVADAPAASTFLRFGENDVLIAGDTKPAITATIASITIKGTATGTASVDLARFGIVAQRIGALKIGGAKIAVGSGANDILLDSVNNDFRVLDFV